MSNNQIIFTGCGGWDHLRRLVKRMKRQRKSQS